MLFFNQVGDEMGGLVFGENVINSHWGGLTFDKFGGDQTMGFDIWKAITANTAEVYKCGNNPIFRVT